MRTNSLMPTTDWCQYNIFFPDRTTAGRVAAHDLLPALTAAQDAEVLHGWWFIRKRPWRLRYLPDGPDSTTIGDLLDKLTSNGRITCWAHGSYEPETRAFGGDAAMDIAHRLFHHDSHYILTRSAEHNTAALGQRETTVLLAAAMCRAAGLDWYEQGDTWERVAALRPCNSQTLCSERIGRLAPAMRRLMTANPWDLCDPANDGPLAGYDGWIGAFQQAGSALAELAHHGKLTRGLRAVLAHHIIFHANRAALTEADQITLASLATTTVFHPTTGPSPLPPTRSNLKVSQVTTVSDSPAGLPADQLRAELANRLRDRKVLRTPAVEAAVRHTPRHLFLPDVPVQEAYADNPVYTKTDGAGVNISAASQPWMVAAMLEQLDAQPGDRIMEAGAGTGYNAALMAAIVGEAGRITTIDVDEDLAAGARRHLAAAGVGNVDVVHGDAALGCPKAAPFDRIIATVGAYEIPPAWLDQLTPHGRLVIPLRLRGTNSRSIVFERSETAWRSAGSKLAVFMPLRGIADDARRYLNLTSDKDVTLQIHNDQTVNEQALAGVLNTERYEQWTGVLFPPNVPFEWMDLWLCLRLDNALMRMNVDSSAKERGLVSPMFGWGAMATTRGPDLAYLTIRSAPPALDGGKLFEVGVVGHGPAGQQLADQVAEEIRVWDLKYRTLTARFEIPDTLATHAPAAGRFLLQRPHHPITVIWE